VKEREGEVAGNGRERKREGEGERERKMGETEGGEKAPNRRHFSLLIASPKFSRQNLFFLGVSCGFADFRV
jgi:hypothetical protein